MTDCGCVLTHEFDYAEDRMRQYVDDRNCRFGQVMSASRRACAAYARASWQQGSSLVAMPADLVDALKTLDAVVKEIELSGVAAVLKEDE